MQFNEVRLLSVDFDAFSADETCVKSHRSCRVRALDILEANFQNFQTEAV